jgi:hypothetical protein
MLARLQSDAQNPIEFFFLIRNFFFLVCLMHFGLKRGLVLTVSFITYCNFHLNNL